MRYSNMTLGAVQVKGYILISTWLLTRRHETVKNMRSALDSVQRAGSEVYGGVTAASVLKKSKCVDDGGRSLRVMGCACFRERCPKELREEKQLGQLNGRLVECSVS